MTNENELDVGALHRDNAIRDFVDRRNLDPEYEQDDAYRLEAFIDGYDFAHQSQQSRIELLESAIRDAAEYHRGYVEKLKESDPDRSARQQDRVNYFMDILEQAK